MSQVNNSFNVSVCSLNRLTIEDATLLASKFFPSAKVDVVNFYLKPFSKEKLGYLAVHESLTIVAYVRDSDTESCKKIIEFFVKSVVPTPNDFDEMIFREESKFFADVVPVLRENLKCEPWAAECYLGKENSLILEDLKSQGFTVARDPLTIDQLKSALTSVARFHASSILLEYKLQEPLNKVYSGFFNEKVFFNDEGYTWKWLLTGIEVIEAITRNLNMDYNYVMAAYELILERIKPTEGQRNVLCHCDLWVKNMMFKEEDGITKCRLVDFQMVNYSSHAVDLTEFIYLNTRRDTRQKIEKELIEYYHSVLKENLQSLNNENGEIINLDDIIREYNEKRICGLIASVQFFPIALLNKQLNQEYTEDAEKMNDYMYKSRKDFVLRAMRLDTDYRNRLEETVIDLLEYMQNL